MHDLLIRGGTVVDGTGAAPRTADVAIRDGRIAEIGARITGAARQTLDADGATVTPGFVDIHTHYDGQFLWDDRLEPSFSHGVTTVVAGNCGVGFAPVAAEHRQALIELMEGVEDIPDIVLDQGLDWDWRSFPDYLDRLAQRRYSMDIATQLPHAPLRVFVMGERALRHERATAADLQQMAQLVREAMAAGALGVSGSRILEHRSSRGAHVPGTFADNEELLTLVRAMAESGRGTFQLAPLGTVGTPGHPENLGAARQARLDEHRRIEALARASGRPVTYVLQQFDSDPGDWRLMLDAAGESNAAGHRLHPQIAARGFGVLLCLDGWHAFLLRPSYLRIAHLPLPERARLMQQPALRAAILAEADVPESQAPSPRTAAVVTRFHRRLPQVFLLQEPLDYEPGPEQALGALAAARGVSVEALLYDHLVANGGTGIAADHALNYSDGSLAPSHEMLRRPYAVSGLGDGGAHMRMICDASMTTSHLTHWARDRQRGERLPLAWLVRKMTADTAALYGFADRGTLQAGQRADLNVIDLDRLALEMPRMVFDLPGGGSRLLQGSRGYLATLVGGELTRRFDADTGARPGRLVRGH